jgi:RES domain-containing protein
MSDQHAPMSRRSVKVKAHPQYLLLRARCRAFLSLATPWEGEAVRYTPLRFGKPTDLLSGEGSYQRGARFNARGTFRAVYASLDPQTATAEIDGVYGRYGLSAAGIPASAKRPQVRVFLRFRLERTLDLHDRRVRKEMEVTTAELLAPWRDAHDGGEEAWTQAFGRAAHAVGFEALLFPSRHSRGVNLVWFNDRLVKGSEVRILHEEDLRKHLK